MELFHKHKEQLLVYRLRLNENMNSLSIRVQKIRTSADMNKRGSPVNAATSGDKMNETDDAKTTKQLRFRLVIRGRSFFSFDLAVVPT